MDLKQQNITELPVVELSKEEEAGTPQLSVLAAPRTSSLWTRFSPAVRWGPLCSGGSVCLMW